MVLNGHLLILCAWEPDLELKQDLFRKIPIWVSFPLLSLQLWDIETISYIALVISNPLHVDANTLHREELAEARALIEVD